MIFKVDSVTTYADANNRKAIVALIPTFDVPVRGYSLTGAKTDEYSRPEINHVIAGGKFIYLTSVDYFESDYMDNVYVWADIDGKKYKATVKVFSYDETAGTITMTIKPGDVVEFTEVTE